MAVGPGPYPRPDVDPFGYGCSGQVETGGWESVKNHAQALGTVNEWRGISLPGRIPPKDGNV
jgi:hypothetical protein